MEQSLNKEQVLQKIEVITDAIDDLIWMDGSTTKYQCLLSNLIYAKNDLQTYVLHNMVSEPAPEPTAEDYIVQLLERFVTQISKEE